MQNTDMHGSAGSTAGGSGFADNLAEKASQFTQTAQQTVSRVSQAASDAAHRLSEHTGEFWGLQERTVESARAYIRAHPIATIGIAIAVGLLLSRLTSRR